MLIYIFENDCQDSLAVLWSLNCMSLGSCSLTWTCFTVFVFFLIQPTTVFYNTVRGQMQLFQLKYVLENPILPWGPLSWSPFSTRVKDDTSSCCVLLHWLTQKRAMPWIIHAASCNACFPSPPSLSSSLLANFHSYYRQVFSCLALRWDEPLKESWLQKYTKH